MDTQFKRINKNLNNSSNLKGGFSLTKLLTGEWFDDYYEDEDDIFDENKTQEAWDNWYNKIHERHLNLDVFHKNDPKYIQNETLKEKKLDVYSNFLIPPLLEKYKFSDIINIFKDYYNFENGKWNTYKGKNILKMQKEQHIKVKDDTWLSSGKVMRVINSLIKYINKLIKEDKGDVEEYKAGIRSIKLALEKPPFKTFNMKLGLSSTQAQTLDKEDNIIKKQEQDNERKILNIQSNNNNIQKTNNHILEEVKSIRKELSNLSQLLKHTNDKISLDTKQTPEINQMDIKMENKMKADKIRSEINGLVQQEEAIIKSLFETKIDHTKKFFKDYL